MKTALMKNNKCDQLFKNIYSLSKEVLDGVVKFRSAYMFIDFPRTRLRVEFDKYLLSPNNIAYKNRITRPFFSKASSKMENIERTSARPSSGEFVDVI